LASNLKLRGRGSDPPDCEGTDYIGRRVAIEITELVDEAAIRAYKQGRVYDFAEWTKEKFTSSLDALLAAKDARYPSLKDPPYDGGYIVVVFTDEPMLQRSTVEAYLSAVVRAKPRSISAAYRLLGYDPTVQRCPYYQLQFGA
jgi:hypothetical protein